MEHWGLLKIATAVPELVIADPTKNIQEIQSIAATAFSEAVDIVCFPELATTGYTCADLFGQSTLIEASNQALLTLAEASNAWSGMLVIVGAPLQYRSRLYN